MNAKVEPSSGVGILPASTWCRHDHPRLWGASSRIEPIKGHVVPLVMELTRSASSAGMKQGKTMKIKYVLTLLVITALSGCAHSTMRGSVAMKASNEEAHVCMGDNEVKAGDKVTLFRNQCSQSGGKVGAADPCHKVKVGEGTVERTLNEHYSVVKVNPGVQFEEGTIVEKQ